MSKMATNDVVLDICRKLAKIDNRNDGELAEASGLSKSTIRRLRNDEAIEFVRSSTVHKLVVTLHRKIVLR